MAETSRTGDGYQQRGHLSAVEVLDVATCRSVLERMREADPPLVWEKGHAAADRAFYEVASHPEVVRLVRSILGDDIMLWGARLVVREPGRRHAWHADVEAWLTTGQTVNVWIGLEHTSADSSLALIPGSHRYPVSVQEEAARADLPTTEEATRADVLALARSHDPTATIEDTELRDGVALVFDGRMWHGSHNTGQRTRTAVLLQYATPATSMRIPDGWDWPFRARTDEQPPCIMIAGSATPDANRIVTPPRIGGDHVSTTRSAVMDLVPVPIPGEGEWRIHRIIDSPRSSAAAFESHASTLVPGHTPHPPHRHLEEEILVVLGGEAVLSVEVDGEVREIEATPGTVAYYPASCAHTLRATADGPVTYLMFKWWSGDSPRDATWLAPTIARAFDELQALERQRDDAGFTTRTVFEGPTRYLWRLQCHVSVVLPGGGYDPHVDPHDVAIVVLEGEVDTGESIVGPGGVILHEAGEPHGLRNDGDVPARYLVVEFHPAMQEPTAPSLLRRVGRRLLPVAAKRFLKQALRIPDIPS